MSMKSVLVPMEPHEGMSVRSGNRAAARAEMRQLHRRLSVALRHQRIRRGRSGGLDSAGIVPAGKSRGGRAGAPHVRDVHAGARRAEVERRSSGLSCGWLDEAPEGESFVGSYGRVFDITVLGRPDANTIGLHNRAIESGLFESGKPILLAPPVAAERHRHQRHDALELQHRAGARFGLRHAAAAPGVAGHGAQRRRRAGGAGAVGRAVPRDIFSSTAFRPG